MSSCYSTVEVNNWSAAMTTRKFKIKHNGTLHILHMTVYTAMASVSSRTCTHVVSFHSPITKISCMNMKACQVSIVRRRCQKLNVSAKVVPSSLAKLTHATWNSWLNCYTIAWRQTHVTASVTYLKMHIWSKNARYAAASDHWNSATYAFLIHN